MPKMLIKFDLVAFAFCNDRDIFLCRIGEEYFVFNPVDDEFDYFRSYSKEEDAVWDFDMYVFDNFVLK